MFVDVEDLQEQVAGRSRNRNKQNSAREGCASAIGRGLIDDSHGRQYQNRRRSNKISLSWNEAMSMPGNEPILGANGVII